MDGFVLKRTKYKTDEEGKHGNVDGAYTYVCYQAAVDLVLMPSERQNNAGTVSDSGD